MIPYLKVEVEISGAWVELTQDITGLTSSTRGILSGKVRDRIATPGRLAFVLDNSHANSAGTLGYYSPDHGSALSGWQEGLKVRAGFYSSGWQSGKVIWRFYGTIQRIKIDPRARGNRKVSVEALDFMNDFNKFENMPQVAALTDASTTAGYRAILDAMTIKPEGARMGQFYLYFDGLTSTADCGDTSDLQDLQSGDFTADGWFRPDSTGEGGTGYFYGKGAVTIGGWVVRFNAGGDKIALQMDFGTTDISETATISASIIDGDFHRITMTYTNSDKKMRLFVDGILEWTTSAGSGSIVTDVGNNFRFGSRFNGAQSFEGGIAWVRILDHVAYTEDFDPRTWDTIPEVNSHTIAIWRAYDTSGTDLPDAAGSNDATLTDIEEMGSGLRLDVLPYQFIRSGERSGSAYEEGARLAFSVFDLIYMDGAGNFVASNRQERILNTTSDATISSDLVNFNYQRDNEKSLDKITSVIHPVVIGTSLETCFRFQGSYTASIPISPGDTYTMVCRYKDPAGSRPVSVVNPVTPVASDHYIFGSVPNGSTEDMNADLGVVANFYSGACELVMTNNGDTVGFVNGILLEAYLIRFNNPVEIDKVIDANGSVSEKFEMAYQDNIVFANTVNDWIETVQTSKDPKSVTFRANNDTTFGYLQNIDIGQIITISESVTGINSTKYFVNGEVWRYNRNKELVIEWYLTKKSTTTNGVWGSSTWNNCVWQFAEGG